MAYQAQTNKLDAREYRMHEVERLRDQACEPDRRALRADLQATVREALQQLPEKYRRTLQLLYLDRDNATIEQVADQLHISPRKVSQMKNRALSILRNSSLTDVLKEHYRE